MTARVATAGGLTVTIAGSGWCVIHAGSGYFVAQGLRQRRFAEEARAELLATGTDFTLPPRELHAPGTRELWVFPYAKWRARAGSREIDRETWEYYGRKVPSGTWAPPPEWAARMREAVACGDREAMTILRKEARGPLPEYRDTEERESA